MEKKALKWYLEYKQRNKVYGEKFHKAYEDLDYIYKELRSKEWIEKQKHKTISNLKKELKLTRTINNAFLIQFKTYHQDLSSFEELFNRCHKDIPRFLKVLNTLQTRILVSNNKEIFLNCLKN